MEYEKNHDIEKNIHHRTGSVVIDEDGAVPGEAFEYGDGIVAKLQRLAGKWGVEQRGIERVPENERTDSSLLNVGTMVNLKSSVARVSSF
jgi:hypothetical protein